MYLLKEDLLINALIHEQTMNMNLIKELQLFIIID